MPTQNLLYRNSLKINNSINISIPKVGDILSDEDGEDKYYGIVHLLTAMPIDMMVQLDDIGVDFTTINEYELFLVVFSQLKNEDTSLVFGDLDLSKFEVAVNEENETIVLVDKENDIVIDRAIHGKIADALRQIHHLEKNIRKPANAAAQEFMIERARKKLNRLKKKTERSQLESLIIAMVNTEQYKYDFEGTLELSIYQFNESVKQIIHKVDYDNRMHGVYAGTISTKDLRQEDLNWLTHK